MQRYPIELEPFCTAQQKEHRALRRQYLAVYLTVMAADWLQGPYLYKLYQFYGYDLVEIALLFLTGFFSGAIAGTAIGSLADSWGRRRVCIVFCVIYGAALMLRFSDIYCTLVVSHLMSGIATSLLFSVFESWYVAEHTKRDLPLEWLSSTFASGTFLNGFVAIMAGVVANALVDTWGYTAPYAASAVLLAFAAVLIVFTWPENCGDSFGKHDICLTRTLVQSCRIMWYNTNILILGAAQTMFECSMYVFVLIYTPAIEEALSVLAGDESDVGLPFGYLFSTMMFAVMVGSVLFHTLDSYCRQFTKDRQLALALGLASVSFWVMGNKSNSLALLLIAYHVYELTIGIYNPSLSALKAQAIPEGSRAAIMALLRIPMNISVGIIMWHIDEMSTSTLFTLCGTLTLIGSVLMIVAYQHKNSY